MRPTDRSPVRRAFVVLLLAAVGAVPVFADVIMTASTGTGVMYGLARELAYSLDASNHAYILSELDWDIKPLIYTQASLALHTSTGFVASLDARLGIPMRSGSISDSDWLNVSYNGDTSRTNYSLSNCYTERAILLDAKLGWDFAVARGLVLQPFLAFDFIDFKWSARAGYLQYPSGWFGGTANKPYPDSSTDMVTPISGTSVLYEQTYFIPAAGLQVQLRLGESFTGSVSVAISPAAFCNDVDNHLVEPGSQDFYDVMFNGFLVEPKVSIDWQLSRSTRLSLDVSYRHIAGLVGTTTVTTTGVGTSTTSVYPGGAGASFDALDASVNLAWSL
jgi:outer membrane protease